MTGITFKFFLSNLERGFVCWRKVLSQQERIVLGKMGITIVRGEVSDHSVLILPKDWVVYLDLNDTNRFDIYDSKKFKRLTYYRQSGGNPLVFHSYVQMGCFVYPNSKFSHKWLFLAKQVDTGRYLYGQWAESYEQGLEGINHCIKAIWPHVGNPLAYWPKRV